MQGGNSPSMFLSRASCSPERWRWPSLSIDWIPYPGIEPRFTIFVGGGGDEVGSAGGGRGRLLWERCAGEARWEWGGRCSGHRLGLAWESKDDGLNNRNEGHMTYWAY
jgi:hypothetical protein